MMCDLLLKLTQFCVLLKTVLFYKLQSFWNTTIVLRDSLDYTDVRTHIYAYLFTYLHVTF